MVVFVGPTNEPHSVLTGPYLAFLPILPHQRHRHTFVLAHGAISIKFNWEAGIVPEAGFAPRASHAHLLSFSLAILS